ncbi:FAD-binding and (Fe-S)-binding domain-containing protein [Winogradskyella sp. A3E31]|uniref:FAD-binding and (Fe-S)-binding domain-containing protein n=1 Tax=Winogradskyella sp. A3E31 TaxID=3349637 RepID=UPI00398A5B6C
MLVEHPIDFTTIKEEFQGELSADHLLKLLYATDASVYRKLPLAVAYPKTIEDLKLLIDFAKQNSTSLIPRAAGTSLAGQCVGKGIIVDVSKHFTRILSVNEAEKTVTLQPGVIRDELNNFLKPFGLFFGPNTSTSNRCMIGGMVGNNSSGTTSIQYGVTRDKVVELKTLLSDGSEVVFNTINKEGFLKKVELQSLEGAIYKTVYDELKSKEVQNRIKRDFPRSEIHRRNTGYAIDALINNNVFTETQDDFNMCQLLSGSEGTLAFTTEITLKLGELPPLESAMVALHFKSIQDCMSSVKKVMQHHLYTCEMMDDTILNLTKHNKAQEANRFFVEGSPKAILMCELRAVDETLLNTQINAFLQVVEKQGLSYANPVLKGNDIENALELRKAGLGLLGNMIGDNKAVACIEDTAVVLEDLSSYINEFSNLMESYKQKPVYYAHAGAGELHLRPILNLKKEEDIILFRKITTDVAKLVKKYNGSLSGEHGDGLVRGEFVPFMIGKENYEILRRIKAVFDPQNIFNPGKIVDPSPMDKNLRYEPNREEPEVSTLLDFSSSKGILREAEKCNGSGDCRKLPEFGGTMCPSYRATKDEKDTTRARANALREILTHSEKKNRFDSEDLKTVFDLCLSCKACSSECPSSVDVASLKAEFQYQYQEENGYSFKNRFFANATKYNKMASRFPGLYNAIFQNLLTSTLIKKCLGIHPKRSLPKVSKSFSKINTLNKGLGERQSQSTQNKTVYLYIDEFTNYLESDIALDTKLVLETLGYKVKCIDHLESGRAHISKGFLKEAKAISNQNISFLKTIIAEDTPLVGIEPSAVFSFRDDYLRLVDDREGAKHISKHAFLIEEFIQKEIGLGYINSHQFTEESKTIKLHGHCYQKALANTKSSFDMLNLPKNYSVTIIPSGCCGMAGSFGYEKDHYDISMTIGEQTLFPAIRKSSQSTIIAANGTSCRHQIKDGTNRLALHPITILKNALK